MYPISKLTEFLIKKKKKKTKILTANSENLQDKEDVTQSWGIILFVPLGAEMTDGQHPGAKCWPKLTEY